MKVMMIAAGLMMAGLTLAPVALAQETGVSVRCFIEQALLSIP